MPCWCVFLCTRRGPCLLNPVFASTSRLSLSPFTFISFSITTLFSLSLFLSLSIPSSIPLSNSTVLAPSTSRLATLLPPPLLQLFLPKISSLFPVILDPTLQHGFPAPVRWLRDVHAGASQGTVASERQRLRDTFQELQQFLREQEAVLQAQLDRAHRELTEERQQYISSVSERKSLLDTLIVEIEKKRDQPVVEFLTVRPCCPPGAVIPPDPRHPVSRGRGPTVTHRPGGRGHSRQHWS